MVHTSEDLKYPYEWGRNIVELFRQTYPRGTNYACRVLGIYPSQFKYSMTMTLCRGNSFKWERMKGIIKLLDVESGIPDSVYAETEKLLNICYLETESKREIVDDLPLFALDR